MTVIRDLSINVTMVIISISVEGFLYSFFSFARTEGSITNERLIEVFFSFVPVEINKKIDKQWL
jgi:hypothetical protein